MKNDANEEFYRKKNDTFQQYYQRHTLLHEDFEMI